MQLVEPLRQALTPDTQRSILELKPLTQSGFIPRRPSIDIYRAVVDDGIRGSAQFEAWLELHHRPFLTFWKPGLTNAKIE